MTWGQAAFFGRVQRFPPPLRTGLSRLSRNIIKRVTIKRNSDSAVNVNTFPFWLSFRNVGSISDNLSLTVGSFSRHLGYPSHILNKNGKRITYNSNSICYLLV